MRKCARPRCEKPLYCMTLCWSHYIKAWRCKSGEVGKYRRTDPTAALEHLRRLRGLGWTWQGISAAAGLSKFTTRHAFYRGSMSHAVAEAVLAVPLEQARPPLRLLDPTGTRRRIEALNFLGWPRAELGLRMGMGWSGLSKRLSQGRITPRTADLVSSLYRELHNVHGPSEQVAFRALLSGFHPPFAWDYVDIDDPKAKPYGGFARSA